MHYFHPTDATDRALNGLALRPDRFRRYDGPDPDLVAWHYAQAVRMRIRGYSVGIDSDDSESERSARSNASSVFNLGGPLARPV